METGTAPARRGRYGIDAPYVPVGLAALAVAAFVAASFGAGVGLLWAGALLALSCGMYLHASVRGKFRVWSRLIDELRLAGGETVLDLGCGRGAVLLTAARHLTTGRAIGVDLWPKGSLMVDQSGNALATTERNAEREGVDARVLLRTADMTDLPIEDAAVDVVVSNLAIHNIPTETDRDQAVAEAVRVLEPGGRLLIADIRHVPRYRDVLATLGMADITVRGLGPVMWWGGPWMATTLVTATKPVL